MSSTPLQSALATAVQAPLPHLGWIRVTGPDRVRWLNGMVTNSIQALAPGQGCYNFILSAQGRIQADLTAFALPDSLLLQTERGRIPAVIALLDRFIIMDDVELAPLELHGTLVAGPLAAETLSTLNLPADRPELTLTQTPDRMLIHAHSPLVPRFELWSQEPVTVDLPSLDPDTLNQLRLLEGIPLFGTDIRDKELAQETGQTRALHFSKGCYLGQEIVERIRSRGNVHRTLSGFVLTGSLPAPGAVLSAQEKSVGELTSATHIPLPAAELTLALGYIRREALELHQAITYPGGTATPISLPYRTAFEQQAANPERVLHVR